MVSKLCSLRHTCQGLTSRWAITLKNKWKSAPTSCWRVWFRQQVYSTKRNKCKYCARPSARKESAAIAHCLMLSFTTFLWLYATSLSSSAAHLSTFSLLSGTKQSNSRRAHSLSVRKKSHKRINQKRPSRKEASWASLLFSRSPKETLCVQWRWAARSQRPSWASRASHPSWCWRSWSSSSGETSPLNERSKQRWCSWQCRQVLVT